jgi:hypothetical protein
VELVRQRQAFPAQLWIATPQPARYGLNRLHVANERVPQVPKDFLPQQKPRGLVARVQFAVELPLRDAEFSCKLSYCSHVVVVQGVSVVTKCKTAHSGEGMRLGHLNKTD